jgi:NitT/TauT family transport system permease protein
MAVSMHVSRFVLRVSVLVSLLLVWHVSTSVAHFGGGFVPTPVETATTLLEWIGFIKGSGQYAGTWGSSVIASGGRVIAGFAIAGSIGVPLGIAIGRSRVVADIFDPIIQLLRPIPVSAWVPFSLVFFGIKPMAAIGLVAVGAFFPFVLNTASGAQHVSELHLRSARMLGASPVRILYAVILPASLPSILLGARLAIGLAWVLVIVAEMVSVKSGLGYDLWNAYYYTRMDVIVAAMASIGVLGFLFDQIILLATRRLLIWHRVTSR